METPSPDGAALERYKYLLRTHDWYYEMSDDRSVYTAGHKVAQELGRLRRAVDPDQKIFKEYWNERQAGMGNAKR